MNNQWNYRFSGTSRTYGEEMAQRLSESHVVVVGLGGVGSWTAEALVRLGIGEITLVDFDDICLSNTNRQLQATTESVGQMKTRALKQRFQSISPDIKIHEVQEMFGEETAGEILKDRSNAVIVDCMDSIAAKCFLIHHCYSNGQPLVVVGGSAGKTEAPRIKVSDISQTFGDRLLHRVRKISRQQYGLPRNIKQKWGIPAVFSDEAPVFPVGDGTVSREVESRPNRPMDCNEGLGSVCFVTGSFGFFAAGEVTRLLTSSR